MFIQNNSVLHIIGLPSLQIPNTADKWKEIAKGFDQKWNFPHCLGALDGKHVQIKKPPGSGSLYYNYKNFFSIVMLAVVNSDYEFLMVDVGMNGRVSDGGILNNSKFGSLLKTNGLNIPPEEMLPNSDKTAPFVFVGDDAFALSDNLLKPFSQTGITLKQRIFNYRLSRARRIVENAFGILNSKFGIFQRSINLAPEKATTVVLACCYLHNYLRRTKSAAYCNVGPPDSEDPKTESIADSSRERDKLTGLVASHSRNASQRSKTIRDTFCDYFSNEGQVPWQNNYCQ